MRKQERCDRIEPKAFVKQSGKPERVSENAVRHGPAMKDEALRFSEKTWTCSH
jgi:hypothetical protein